MNLRNIQRVLAESMEYNLLVSMLSDGRFIADIRKGNLSAGKGCEIAGTPEAALFMLNVRLMEDQPVLVGG